MITTSPVTHPTPRASPTGRDYLSYSAISAYQRCPLAFFFRYVADLPEAMISSSLVFGASLHRAFELQMNELLAGAEPPSLESLLGEFDAAWREYDQGAIRYGKDEDKNDLTGLAQRMLSKFQASSLARPEGTILGVEEELRGPVVSGCPDILGRLDLIVETVDAVVVTDLKTARTRWSQTQVEESASQLLLYHELARSLVPNKRLRLQFAVCTKSKQPAFELHQVPADPKQITRTKRVVERVWRSIESGNFYPSPSPVHCPTCPYRGPCRAWQG